MCGSDPPETPPPIQPATQPGGSAFLEPLTPEQVALRSRRNTSGITDAVRTAMLIPTARGNGFKSRAQFRRSSRTLTSSSGAPMREFSGGPQGGGPLSGSV